MNNYKFLSRITFWLLLLNLGFTLFLLFRKPPHPDRPNPKMHIIQQLELDEKQIQQYEQLIQRHRATIHPLEAEITSAKKRLMQTLIVEKSETYTDSLTSKIGHLQQEIERAHLLHFQQIHALCKPNQQVKFQQLVSELDAIFGPKKPPHRMKD